MAKRKTSMKKRMEEPSVKVTVCPNCGCYSLTELEHKFQCINFNCKWSKAKDKPEVKDSDV